MCVQYYVSNCKEDSAEKTRLLGLVDDTFTCDNDALTGAFNPCGTYEEFQCDHKSVYDGIKQFVTDSNVLKIIRFIFFCFLFDSEEGCIEGLRFLEGVGRSVYVIRKA